MDIVGGVRASLALLLFLLAFECLLTGFGILLFHSFLDFEVFQFSEGAFLRLHLMTAFYYVQINTANLTQPFTGFVTERADRKVKDNLFNDDVIYIYDATTVVIYAEFFMTQLQIFIEATWIGRKSVFELYLHGKLESIETPAALQVEFSNNFAFDIHLFTDFI